MPKIVEVYLNSRVATLNENIIKFDMCELEKNLTNSYSSTFHAPKEIMKYLLY